ncbi:DNA replication/repair protein RecF [Aliidiomarina haloalkalitolerans]|uniref:DNA replication and repair protein RecF n=1 Tax=Aliidiomarina haloalkalitolerans TaxID=859059 RepID=A0A432VS60_9GAMM|nr:DNA replication/repair protein RecF [Aliidiomarina haloalkalitolerans]RUO19168.1 DNA replication/repair protein RecF [Aliidiomarina haloalkalitolerans]
MQINQLVIAHFRNIANAQLEPSQHVNVIYGENGSGKTSVLEAIYTLGFGRSFRTHQVRQVVQDEHEALTLFTRTQDSNESDTQKVGFRRFRNGETEIRINGETERKFSALARLMPIQLITPEGVTLVTDGPKERRQYMDWGLFHVEQNYYSHWLTFSRLLKQRNSLLKQRSYHQQGGEYWDQQLALAGEAVTEARVRYLDGLNQKLNKYCQQFLPQYQFEFKLQRGWQEQQSLAEALAAKLELDLRQGFTSVGPTKAEWQIRVDGIDARERLSRGQLKLLVAALRLVQSADYFDRLGKRCVILVDDLPAELDAENQQRLCNALLESGSQVFITAIRKEELEHRFKDTEVRLFHVEQGTIKND